MRLISTAPSTARCPGCVQNRCRENLSFSQRVCTGRETFQAPALSVFLTLTRLLLSGESRKTAEGRTLRQKY